MTPIGWDYLAYAFANTALLLGCGLACVVFAILTLRSALDRDRDVTLWWILPWTVVTWAAVSLIPASWIWPRLGDPKLSVDFIRTVYESQADYGSYLARTVLLLAAVLGKVAIIWWTGRWSGKGFIVILAVIALISYLSTDYHLREIEGYCHDPPACRVD